jgi:hypothetical protein
MELYGQKSESLLEPGECITKIKYFLYGAECSL